MVTFSDRVAEFTTTVGTGPVALEGAVPSYRRFLTGYAVGSEIGYTIVDEVTGDFECGTGTLTSGTALRRDAVSASSASGAFVAFGAGTKIVAAVTLAADQTLDQGTY